MHKVAPRIEIILEDRQTATHTQGAWTLCELRAAGLPAVECRTISRGGQRAVEIELHEEADDGAGVFGWGAEAVGAMAWLLAEKALAHAWFTQRDGRQRGDGWQC